ncbi:hypothetical protein BDV06DRAFT_189591 [Aspergillus oleicola]
MHLLSAKEKIKALMSGRLGSSKTNPATAIKVKGKDNGKGKAPLRSVSYWSPAFERKPLPRFVPWYRLEARENERGKEKEQAEEKGKRNKGDRSSCGGSCAITLSSKPTTTSPTNSQSRAKRIARNKTMAMKPILPGLLLSTHPHTLSPVLLKLHSISSVLLTTSATPKSTSDTLHNLRIKSRQIKLENCALQDLLKHLAFIADFIEAGAPRRLRSFSLKEVEDRDLIESEERDIAIRRGHGPSARKGALKD